MKIDAATDSDLEWAAEKVGVPHWKPDAVGITARVNEKIVAVVVYEAFSMCDAQMSVASDGSRRWLSRTLLRASFSVPFIIMDLKRVTFLVGSKNERSIKLCIGLGFTVEGRLEDGLPDDDLIVFGMTKRRCPYIPREWRKHDASMDENGIGMGSRTSDLHH